MPLYGSLKTMPLPDILQWLSAAPRSGVLTVSRELRDDFIFFERGTIVAYSYSGLRDEMVHAFAAYGQISEEQYHQLVMMHRELGRSMESILIDEGWVSEADVQGFLLEHAQEGILNLFLVEDGNFAYNDGETVFGAALDDIDSAHGVRLSLSANALLLEGVRRLDEWEQVREQFPASAILRLGQPLPEGLSARDLRILRCAEQGCTVAEICLELRLSLYTTYQIVKPWVASGVIEVEPSAEVPHTPAGRDRLALICEQAQLMFNARQFEEAIALYNVVLTVNPAHEGARRGVTEASAEQVRELYENLPPMMVPRLSKTNYEIKALSLTPEERFIASRINGEWDVGTLVMLSPLPEPSTLKVLKKLRHIGVVE